MKKKFVKAAAFAAFTALLLSLCMTTAWAAPERITKSVPTRDTSFSIPLIVDGGGVPYAGIEFGLTISNEAALSFASFELGASVSGATKSPFTTRDGVHYFGFFTNENAYKGRYTVGVLEFKGYTGSEAVTVTLSHMKVVRLLEDNTTAGQENSEAVYVITVRRSSSSSNSDDSNIVIDLPDPETPLAGGYIDVAEGDWFYEAVTSVTEMGLMNGTGENRFSPNVPMTRAMFVQVLANLEKAGLSGYVQSTFTDVSATAWYAKPIAWAADVGIVMGVGGRKFEPERQITREEMAVMLNNYINWKGVELEAVTRAPFGDFGEVSSWAADAVTAIQGYGIISGVGENLYAPKRTATRAEVAQIFANFLEAKAQAK